METEWVILAAESMVRENRMSEDGLDLLTSLKRDPYHEYLYHSIVLKLTEMYGEWEKRDEIIYSYLLDRVVQTYIRLYTVKRRMSPEEIKACTLTQRAVFMQQ